MPAPKLSRRAFIRLLSLIGIGSGLALLERITQPIGAAKFVQWQARSRYQQFLAPRAVVALIECPSYQAEIVQKLSDFWNAAGMPKVHGQKVLIKPNLVDTVAERPAITAPQATLAVVDLLKGMGASQVSVGDGPAFRREAQSVLSGSGLIEALKDRNVPFIDLNYDDPQPLPAQKDWFIGIKEIWLPRHVVEADLIISLPKMKMHHWAGASLSLKNLLGVLPGCRYGWPKNFIHFRGITASILGLYQMLPPVAAIVDGVVGMEGDGPVFGMPVAHGVLAMGADPLAVDITCARLMGFEPWEVEHLGMAAYSGLGQFSRIETIGASFDQLKRNYQRPPSI